MSRLPTATCAVIFCSLLAVHYAAAQPRAAKVSADPALAARLCEYAQTILRANNPSSHRLRQAAALLEGAAKLDPSDQRYVRLLADARLHLNEPAGAIAALTAFRKINPGDRMAQIELIELYLGQMQTIQQRIGYLQNLVARDDVPAEVRSVLGFRLAVLLREKGDHAEAAARIDESLRLNPLNLPSLRARLELLGNDAAPGQRLGILLDMLRSNPAQPAVVVAVAREVAEAGLAADTVQWYDSAVRVSLRSGQGIVRPLIAEFATALLINDQIGEAQKFLDQLLSVDPEDYPSLVLRILIEKRAGNAETLDRFRMQARNALLNRLALIRKHLGVASATTRPVTEGVGFLPDLAADIELYKKSSDAAAKDVYLQSVADLAWFEVYFNERPDEAEKLLKHFSQFVDDKNPFAARLAGWIFLARKKAEEANVKLSAVAGQDPLAALGLIRITAIREPPQAAADAQKLLSDHPAGLQGAILAEALRPLGAKVTAAGQRAKPIQDVLRTFPQEWMRIIDSPQMFYSIRGEPLKINHEFAEPMYARLTITNTNQYDITIGPDGIIGPIIWFDARVGGMNRIPVPGVAIERLTDQVILKPRQSATTLLRVDQGQVQQILNRDPRPPMTIMVAARTNPISSREGIAAGAGGYMAEFLRPMERAPTPPSKESLQRAVASASSTDGRERIRTFTLLGIYARSFRNSKDNPEAGPMAEALLDPLRAARQDPDPSARAAAALDYVLFGPEADRIGTIQRMGLDQAWQPRLLALLAAAALPEQTQRHVLTDALDSPEPFIKEFATASVEIMKNKPPETQPAN